MANANSTASESSRIERDSLNHASLLLAQLHALIDTVFTLACANKVEELCTDTLANLLHNVMVLCENAQDLIVYPTDPKIRAKSGLVEWEEMAEKDRKECEALV